MSNIEQAAETKGKEKEFTIIINGREVTVSERELSFDAIVVHANVISGPNIVYTVTFRRGRGEKPEGNLEPGGTVKIKEGMIFNVTATDKS